MMTRYSISVESVYSSLEGGLPTVAGWLEVGTLYRSEPPC